MKHDKIRHWLLFLLACCLSSTPCKGITPTDSVDISLLTCSPHEEVYALYGHSALRLLDHTTGEDFAINYGVFSFEQPHFVARFVFGLTDYQMGVCPFKLFYDEYAYEGRSVTEVAPSPSKSFSSPLQRKNASWRPSSSTVVLKTWFTVTISSTTTAPPAPVTWL